MAGLEAIIKSQKNVISEMLGTISQQNKSLVSIDNTLNKIYELDKKEARERRQDRQDARRKLIKGNSRPPSSKNTTKSDSNEGGGFLDKLLGFFAIGGILDGILRSTLDGIFGKQGLLSTGWNALVGKNGLFVKGWNKLVGKDGLLLKGWNGLVGKNGLFAKGWNNLVKEDGILAKASRKLGDVGKAIKEGPLGKLFKKFPKLGTLGDDLSKGLGKFGKFAKSIKGGGILSGLVSGGLKFAETGDTGQAVTQGAGAGAGALAGGAIGSLIAPGIGTAIGAAIGGLAGDFLTEELRKMGWLEPIEDSINKVVDVFRGFIDYMSPVFEGFISSFTDTFESLKVTFGLIGKAGQKLTKDIGNVINGIKDTLGGWWDGFQSNIIDPLTDAFGKVVAFLKPILDPLQRLATTIINPLATALGMLFDKIKNLPIIGNLFKGLSEDDRRGIGRGIGDFFTGRFNIINNAVQGGLRSYVGEEKQMGGPITIPGSSFGDSYPMALPPGSFVLNRRASEQYGFQSGGMVPTILEPGEKVFLPGTYGPEVPMMNEMVPRFQEGGGVKEPKKGGKFEYPMPKGYTGTKPYQVFGAPRDGGARKHAGVDLVESAPWGSDPKLPIVAPKDGVVSQERYTTSGYTAGLILNQTDGYDTRYVHMTPEVGPGTEVKAGDRIGKLIDLKNNSHLHFELYKSGSSSALNPAGYLTSAGRTPGAGSKIPGMSTNPDGPKGEESGGGGSVKDSASSESSGVSNKMASSFFGALASKLSSKALSLLNVITGGKFGSSGESENKSGSGTMSPGVGSGVNSPVGGGYTGDPGDLAVSGDVGQKGVDITKKIMKDSGATKQAAAAIAGNMAHESAGFIPGIREGGPFGKSSKPWPKGTVGKGYGWAQWTNSAPGDRYDKFIASYGGDYNKIPSNADNYNFLMGELLTGNGGFIKKGRGTSGSWDEFKKKTNVTNATVDFRKTWERAGVAHDGPRIKYAKEFLSELPPGTDKTKSTPPEKKQSGGMVGTKYMSNASTKSQDFRQTNMKQMSQSAKYGSPIVIVNNSSQQSAPQMSSDGSGARVPSLPNEPGNNVWKSYYNFAQRISIG